MSTDTNNPSLPQKCIFEKPHLVDVFCRSSSYAKIITYIQACAESVARTPRSRRLTADLRACPAPVRFFADTFFPRLHGLVDRIPLEDMRLQRFGNKSFRAFHAALAAELPALSRALVATFSVRRDESAARAIADEVAAYLQDAFGNCTRIDYGTGHELHFFVALAICLEECGDDGGTLHDAQAQIVSPQIVPPPPPVAEDKRDEVRRLRQGIVFEVFGRYMEFMRRLQQRYSLEPAGSHGVWGLDDYHHMPFIFGAAQLIDAEVKPMTHAKETEEETVGGGGAGHGVILPKHICEESEVQKHADEYFYFAQIAWIRENKSGPFFEHSSMLYNISGVEHWGKIYTGMIKMYAAEVLAKFPVVQHLLFGPHLPWVDA